MKKYLLIAFLILYTGMLKAQLFGEIGFGVNTPSIHTQIGYLSQLDHPCKAQIMAGVLVPINDNIPKAVYLLAGGQLINYNDIHITPSIGISNLWLPDGEKLEQVTGVYMVYAIDVSKRIYKDTDVSIGITNTNNYTFLNFKFRVYIMNKD